MQLTIENHVINIDDIYDTIQHNPERFVKNPCVIEFKFTKYGKKAKFKLQVHTGTKDRFSERILIDESVWFIVDCRGDRNNNYNSAQRLSCHELTKDDILSAIGKITDQVMHRWQQDIKP